MSRVKCDPLKFIPPPDKLRQQLEESRRFSERLEILLRVSEQVHATEKTNDSQEPAIAGR